MDSNTITDYLLNKLPDNVASVIENSSPKMSVISRIEILVWKNATREQLELIESFISVSLVYNLNEEIIQEAIKVRKIHRLKLPDAIIAATAIVNRLVLITNNLSDFNHIKNLKIISSYSVP